MYIKYGNTKNENSVKAKRGLYPICMLISFVIMAGIKLSFKLLNTLLVSVTIGK